MALLQISEPGKSTLPHEHRLAVGIDLGTTNSLIASVISGKATILEDEEGSRMMPSIVHYDEKQIFVGVEAEKRQVQGPEDTIASAKRLMSDFIASATAPSFGMNMTTKSGVLWPNCSQYFLSARALT